MKFLSNLIGLIAKPKKPTPRPVTEPAPSKPTTQPERLAKVSRTQVAKTTEPRQQIEVLEDRQVIPQEIHGINVRQLDNNAVKVVYGLIDGGYDAYLVGGCVRDLLMGLKPKDFDVTTAAHPEQAHTLFKRSRLIGRRFKLLHVRFGRDLIEVATFRAAHDSQETENKDHGRQNDAGMIVRDNVYGNITEDALRRDFTANALYFDVENNTILDFAGGYEDIQNRTLRMIGDPDARYREDPVRMLRAARFRAKLDFKMDPATEAPIRQLAPLLNNISPARLFDEALKLLQSGYGLASLKELERYHLLSTLLPLTEAAMADAHYGATCRALVEQALENTDRRLKQQRSVTPAFLFAALLWYPMLKRMNQLITDEAMPPIPALHEAANEILARQVRHTAIPKRFSVPLKEIWELQLRLPRRHGKKAEQLREHPRFRAAFDLLQLRAQAGEQVEGEPLSQVYEWWSQYQGANGDQQQKMATQVTEPSGSKKRRRPRRRRPQGGNGQES